MGMKKRTPILEMLDGYRIFDIEMSKDRTTVKFWENCDRHFDCDLNRDEMDMLIEELKLIRDEMVR